MCNLNIREASCLCGKVRVKVEGEPDLSLACNCTNCQRRSGAPFSAIVYFKDKRLFYKQGDTKSFTFTSDSGQSNTIHFCPNCGSTVMMKPQMFAGMTGFGAGSFNDPEIPSPTMSAWTQSKYKWVEFPKHWHQMERQTPG